jgi:flagellar basal-body rod modification protein FlgD
MNVLGVQSIQSALAGQSGAIAGVAESRSLGVDRNAFMQLLLAQLRNQDPMKPMEDKEFIGQLAQLNTLEEMQKLNDNILQLTMTQGLLQGSNLIGKWVKAAGTDGVLTEGLVSSVSMANNQVSLVINGKSVLLNQVLEVKDQV